MWENFSADKIFSMITPLMRGDQEYFSTDVDVTLWEKNSALLVARRQCTIWASGTIGDGRVELKVNGLDIRYEATDLTVITKVTATLPGTDIETPGWPTYDFIKRELPFVMRPGDTWTMVLPK